MLSILKQASKTSNPGKLGSNVSSNLLIDKVVGQYLRALESLKELFGDETIVTECRMGIRLQEASTVFMRLRRAVSQPDASFCPAIIEVSGFGFGSVSARKALPRRARWAVSAR